MGGYLANKMGDVNNLGFFATPLALETAYPVGAPGYFAVVGSTDTIWVWDSDSNTWVDSGTSISESKGILSMGRNAITSPINSGNIYYVDTDSSGQSIGQSEPAAGNIMPISGTIKNLFIDVFSNNNTVGSSIFTIMKNGVATTVTVTVLAGVTSITSDTTHTVSVAAGDRITLKCDLSTGDQTESFGFSYELH